MTVNCSLLTRSVGNRLYLLQLLNYVHEIVIIVMSQNIDLELLDLRIHRVDRTCTYSNIIQTNLRICS